MQPHPPQDPASQPKDRDMTTATLTIDLPAIVANWRALDRLTELQ